MRRKVAHWQLSGIWTASTGGSYTVGFSYQSGGSSVNLTGSPDYDARIRIVGDPGSGCNYNDLARQFNTAAFMGPAVGSVGLDSGGGYLRGAYVHYGLGNFVFYSGGGVTAQSGVLLLTMRGRAVTASKWVPAAISGGIPIPLEGAAATRAVSSWQSLRRCTGLAARP